MSKDKEAMTDTTNYELSDDEIGAISGGEGPIEKIIACPNCKTECKLTTHISQCPECGTYLPAWIHRPSLR